MLFANNTMKYYESEIILAQRVMHDTMVMYKCVCACLYSHIYFCHDTMWVFSFVINHQYNQCWILKIFPEMSETSYLEFRTLHRIFFQIPKEADFQIFQFHVVTESICLLSSVSPHCSYHHHVFQKKLATLTELARHGEST